MVTASSYEGELRRHRQRGCQEKRDDATYYPNFVREETSFCDLKRGKERYPQRMGQQRAAERKEKVAIFHARGPMTTAFGEERPSASGGEPRCG